MRKYLISAAVAAIAFAAAPAQAQAIWEADYGTAIVSGDDNTADGSFGFLFPFLGTSYSGATFSTNGFLTLGGSVGSDCCNGDVGRLLAGPARIAPEWFDLVGTVYLNTSVADRAVVTWTGGEYSWGGNYAFQAQLFADGSFIFGYQNDAVPGSHIALTGYSAGNGASDPGAIDFSTAHLGGVSAYQTFASGTFDLNGSNVTFTPNGSGGYAINAMAGVPEPAAWGMMIGGFGMAGAALRRRARTRVQFA